MDKASLFHLSYGLFVVGVNGAGKLNGCIVNSVIQITSSPVQAVVVINKNNYTHELIKETGSLALSILAEDVEMDVIARFGFASGKDTEKFEQMPVEVDNQGNPYLPKYSTARLSGKVTNMVDVGSHTMFIFEVTEGEVLNNKTPLTYKYYQEVKKGTSPKNATTYQDRKDTDQGQYYCTVCQHVYEGEIPFEELGEEYRCPVCNHGKEAFRKK